MEYIIVQAGGKGSRLQYLTRNKPKALVPVENLPMIFHLFRKYPDKKFIIIADYKKDVLRAYLAAFAAVKYLIVEADGTGTCSGIRQAVQFIPEGEPFLLVWSDLILPATFKLPEEYEADHGTVYEDYIGISRSFPCRWSYREGRFVEMRSWTDGVAGFFLFSEKRKLEAVPQSGELVRWMQQKQMKFREISLAGTREFGLLEEYEKLEPDRCRPFNRITIKDNVVVKEPLDRQGEKLSVREQAWYQQAEQLKLRVLPRIDSFHPLQMEYIQGKNVYECQMDYKEKKQVLKMLAEALHQLHRSKEVPADFFSMKEAYFHKTMKRLEKIADLVPFARERQICINGKMCRNVFYYRRELEKKLEELTCEKFCLIHGDCTFSNLMLREDGSPVLIDPRGYFGFTELYGDVRYDWAKLYYSIVGNYDRFNLKDFRLEIGEKEVFLKIASNGWEDMEKDFFAFTGAVPDEMQLLHAVIWLSLTTYAWQDYDSVCGAFYNGLHYLEDIL